MKQLLLYLLITFNFCNAQTYTLTVTNGYGSGNYQAGQAVHIYSKEFGVNQFFDQWTGDIASIENKENWHTTLIMPNTNVSVNAIIDNYTTNLTNTSIQGQNIAKPVNYAFPANYQGVIYFLHGSGGSANVVNSSIEVRNFIGKALKEGFAIITTEAEESTLNQDLNGDGAIRWKTYPYTSSANIDISNIEIINTHLTNLGILNNTKPKYTVGISNGGWFAQTLALALNFNKSVSYIGQGEPALYDNSGVIEMDKPVMWIMSANDGNPLVGVAGLNTSQGYSNQLVSENICSKFITHNPYPMYPERFARDELSLLESNSTYQELLNNGHLTSNKIPNISGFQLASVIQSNPLNYPFILSLNNSKLNAIRRQWDISFAEHIFYDDYNANVINFLKNGCETLSTIEANINFSDIIAYYPNPTTDFLNIKINKNYNPNKLQILLHNSEGRLLKSINPSQNDFQIDFTNKMTGVYAITIIYENKKIAYKIIKK